MNLVRTSKVTSYLGGVINDNLVVRTIKMLGGY